MTQLMQLHVLRAHDDDSLETFGERHGLIGKDEKFLSVLEEVRMFSPLRKTVLVRGETGTGKELIAQALHTHADLPGKFVPINCGDLGTAMARGELAGYKGKSFTGSDDKDRPGLFQAALGGTLFLDEIQLLTRSTQGMFLRAMDQKTILPLGADEEVSVANTRIVMATNEHLETLIEKRTFRKDLFYRIPLTITIPPLRERTSDIALLANHFLCKHRKECRAQAQQISEKAIELLMHHSWPGNARELENVIFSILVRNQTTTIIELDHIRRAITIAPAEFPPSVPASSIVFPLSKAIDPLEKAVVCKALALEGTISGAARLLHLDRSILRARMRKHGLKLEP